MRIMIINITIKEIIARVINYPISVNLKKYGFKYISLGFSSY